MTVGIVGAGISGLALAHALARNGEEFVVFEAAEEPGGVVRSRDVDGRVLDLGPQRTRLTPAVRDLVTDLDLAPRLRRAHDGRLYVYHDGELREAPTDLRAALRTDLLSWPGKLRTLAEPLTRPPQDGETVGGFLRRAFGEEVATRFVGPLYAGLYGSAPDEMPVEHSFGRALDRLGSPRCLLLAALKHDLRGRDPPPVVSFENGLGELPHALAARYDDRVHLASPVETVERVHGSGDDGGARYRVETPNRGTTVEDLVLTTPAPVTADLLSGVAPDAAAVCSALTYNPLAVVHLAAERGGVAGAGYQVALDEGLSTRGVTSNHGLFGRHGLHTAYLGGSGDEGVLDWDDDRLAARAAREFATVTGLEADPVAVHRIRPGMPAYDRSWDALDDLALPPGLHIHASFAARAGIPGRVREARHLAAALSGAAN